MYAFMRPKKSDGLSISSKKKKPNKKSNKKSSSPRNTDGAWASDIDSLFQKESDSDKSNSSNLEMCSGRSGRKRRKAAQRAMDDVDDFIFGETSGNKSTNAQSQKPPAAAAAAAAAARRCKPSAAAGSSRQQIDPSVPDVLQGINLAARNRSSLSIDDMIARNTYNWHKSMGTLHTLSMTQKNVKGRSGRGRKTVWSDTQLEDCVIIADPDPDDICIESFTGQRHIAHTFS